MVRKNAKLRQHAAAKETADAKCRTDLQCMGEKLISSASIYCDNHIEKLAKFDHEWTDGMLEPKFALSPEIETRFRDHFHRRQG